MFTKMFKTKAITYIYDNKVIIVIQLPGEKPFIDMHNIQWHFFVIITWNAIHHCAKNKAQAFLSGC